MLELRVGEEFKTVVAEAVREALKEIGAAGVPWPEKIWTVPAECRLSVEDFAAVVQRSKQCIYRWSKTKAVKVRKLDGVLVFRAADVRSFLTSREEIP